MSTRFAVQRTHRDDETGEFGDPMFLHRTPRSVNYQRRNQYADTHAKWAARVQDALTFAKRETAERHATAQQQRADWSDEHHYRSKVGDTVVTVVEVHQPMTTFAEITADAALNARVDERFAVTGSRARGYAVRNVIDRSRGLVGLNPVAEFATEAETVSFLVEQAS